MDADINYAKRAGISYWAFCYYPSGSGLDIGRNLYFSSSQRAGLNYSYIFGTGSFPAANFSALVTEFSRPYYQKVMNNRPILYLLDGTGGYSASDIATLRSLTTAAGLGTPYIVVMSANSANASSWATTIGADAISAYTTALGGGVSYSNLMAQNSSDWASHTATGKKVVPWVATGWDNRPRYYNPVTWLPTTPAINEYVQQATAVQVGSQLQNAINRINSVPSASDANTVIVYAWNEFDEGGWLTPTLTSGEDRITSVSEVLKYASSSNWDASYTASKAFDGNPATAWQSLGPAYAGQWLEVDFGEDSTFSQATLSEYGNRTSGYRIEYLNGTTWKTAYTGTTIGASSTVSFPAVTGRKARIYFTSGSNTAILYEFSTNKTAVFTTNIGLNKTYSSSTPWDASQTADKAFDGNLGTNWQGSGTTFAGQYLTVDFGVRKSFNTTKLSDFGGRTTGYRIEYWNGGSWSTAYTGGSIGTSSTVTFPTVTSSKARLYFTSGTLTPIIYELEYSLN